MAKPAGLGRYGPSGAEPPAGRRFSCENTAFPTRRGSGEEKGPGGTTPRRGGPSGAVFDADGEAGGRATWSGRSGSLLGLDVSPAKATPGGKWGVPSTIILLGSVGRIWGGHGGSLVGRVQKGGVSQWGGPPGASPTQEQEGRQLQAGGVPGGGARMGGPRTKGGNPPVR